jgi:hypothetical protein
MIDTVPAEGTSSIVVRVYRADSYEELVDAFHRDAVLLLLQGYEPAAQHYVEGQWSLWRALLATLLIPFLIGLFLWAQMLVQRPTGVLTATYVHRAGPSPAADGS